MAKTYKRILFLTGAGISAESGLATFRSENGLWNNHRVEMWQQLKHITVIKITSTIFITT